MKNLRKLSKLSKKQKRQIRSMKRKRRRDFISSCAPFDYFAFLKPDTPIVVISYNKDGVVREEV